MSSKTRIVVLHMKEIIYTVVFAVLGILLFILFAFMFFPKSKESSASSAKYIPGIYTSTVTLNHMDFEIEVAVDESHINGIRFHALDDSIAAMYPLVQPAAESIATQICETQSLEQISFDEKQPYTSQIILRAISDALKKAEVTTP